MEIVENYFMLVYILLKFIPKGSTDKTSGLVQIMAWRWIRDKQISEPMMV